MIEGSTLTLQAKKSSGPAQFHQLWKITHIGQHYYSIRSLYRPDLALHAHDDGTVDVATLDVYLSGSDIPLNRRWKISRDGSGYLFHFAGTLNLELRPQNDTLSADNDVVVGFQANDTFSWTLGWGPTVEDQVLLINTQNGLPATNAVRYVFPDVTSTLSELNMMASFITRSTQRANYYWVIASGEERIATVDWNTGSVSGVSSGTITIKARAQLAYQDAPFYYSNTFTVKVIPPEGTYYIKNKQTGFHMGVFTDTYPEDYYVTDLSYSGSATQRWIFDYLGNGLYSIKSADSSLGYLGIEGSSSSAGAEVVLKSSVTRWYIEKNNRGTYTFTPYGSASNDLVMAVPTDAYPLQQLTFTDDGDLRDGWVLYDEAPTYRATVTTVYDLGYPVYYGYTEAQGAYWIDVYTQAVADRFMEVLGLDITATVATYQQSDIDDCKGTISSSTIDDLCEHSSDHTDGDTFLSYVKRATGGSNEHTTVFWTCHYITPVSSVGGSNNRSLSSEDVVLLLKRVEDSNDRYRVSTGVLMHELCHQFGANDHYHEVDEDMNCKNQDICSECGTNPRPKTCLMYNSEMDITANTVLCDECKQDILDHLNEHDLFP